MNRFFGPLVLGLLLGGVLGGLVGVWFLAPDSESRNASPPQVQAAGRSREPGLAAKRPSLSVPVESRDASAAEEPALPAVAREILAQVEPAVAVHGNGSISGQVMDQDGAPVPGVMVLAKMIRPSDPSAKKASGPPEEETLEQRIRTAVEDYRRAKAEDCQAISREDGRYTLSGLTDAEYSLKGYLKEHEVRGGSTRARAGDEVNFTAAALVSVTVSVAQPDGSPAREATIECRRSGPRESTSSERWVANDPVILVAPGAYELRATVGRSQDRALGDDELTSDPRTVELAVGQTPEPLRFELHGRAGVKGRVKLTGDEELDHVEVRLVQVPPGQEPDPKSLPEGERSYVRFDRPEFAFRDVKPGRYALGVARGYGETLSQLVVVEITDRMVKQDLELPPLSSDDCLIVHVCDTESKPVTNASFQLRRKASRSSSSSGVSATLNRKTQAFWLPIPSNMAFLKQSKWDDGVEATLIVESKGLGRKEVELTAGMREITVRFGELATLTVQVSGYQGSGLEGSLSAGLRRAGSDEDLRFRGSRPGGDNGEIGADGKATIGPVEIGDYELLLYARPKGEARRSSTERVATSSVRLHAGDNAITVEAPQLYSITIQVSQGKPGDSIGLESREAGTRGQWRQAELNDKGVAVFDRLSPGDYKANYWGGGTAGSMRIHVPGPSNVTFQPELQNAMLVTVSDRKGVLATAGFENGDLMIGIDGKEFTDTMDMQASVAGSLGKTEATFIVLRGKKKLEVKMNPRAFMEPDKLGGEIEPTTR